MLLVRLQRQGMSLAKELPPWGLCWIFGRGVRLFWPHGSGYWWLS